MGERLLRDKVMVTGPSPHATQSKLCSQIRGRGESLSLRREAPGLDKLRPGGRARYTVGLYKSRTHFAPSQGPEVLRGCCGRWPTPPSLARSCVSPTEAREPVRGQAGAHLPKVEGAPAQHSRTMLPRDSCTHQGGAMSMPVPVGGKRGKEEVGAVETWTPDNLRAVSEIAASAP